MANTKSVQLRRTGQSALADRIAAGLADPISDEERKIAAGMRDFYESKFGRPAIAQNPESM